MLISLWVVKANKHCIVLSVHYIFLIYLVYSVIKSPSCFWFSVEPRKCQFTDFRHSKLSQPQNFRVDSTNRKLFTLCTQQAKKKKKKVSETASGWIFCLHFKCVYSELNKSRLKLQVRWTLTRQKSLMNQRNNVQNSVTLF